MKLYYRDFLMFLGETNSSLRERLGMNEEKKKDESQYRKGARLLRAFILSKLDLSRIIYFDSEELHEKQLKIFKVINREKISFFPFEISNKRREYLLDKEEEYKDLIIPNDIECWKRIKSMGDCNKWGALQLEEKPIFDTEELFLDREAYLRLFEIFYLSTV